MCIRDSLNPDKATNNPGDSKESLIARKAYLTKGYYDIILENVIKDVYKRQCLHSIMHLSS